MDKPVYNNQGRSGVEQLINRGRAGHSGQGQNKRSKTVIKRNSITADTKAELPTGDGPYCYVAYKLVISSNECSNKKIE